METEMEMEIIDKYTRKEAIEDGVLVDVSEMAKEAGYKYPCVITTAVHAMLNKAEVSNTASSYKGVLWDILNMSKHGKLIDPQTRIFSVIIIGCGRKRIYQFKAMCHGGDNHEPVLTIMLPNED